MHESDKIMFLDHKQYWNHLFKDISHSNARGKRRNIFFKIRARLDSLGKLSQVGVLGLQ